jgi:hypothetical protein
MQHTRAVAIAEGNLGIKMSVAWKEKGQGDRFCLPALPRGRARMLMSEKGGYYGYRNMETKVGNHPVETIQGIRRMGAAL